MDCYPENHSQVVSICLCSTVGIHRWTVNVQSSGIMLMLIMMKMILHSCAPCLFFTSTRAWYVELCRGSELERETAWVIFDEVHYMQDRERGVVWEETIIFLPPEVKMVFLSATLSNSLQFASWISQLRQQPCHVVYTDYRPTPLQHYAFPQGGVGLHLVRPHKPLLNLHLDALDLCNLAMLESESELDKDQWFLLTPFLSESNCKAKLSRHLRWPSKSFSEVFKTNCMKMLTEPT